MKESRRPMARTLDAWMPRRSGVTVKNKFRESQVGAVNDGVVRVTVDSGAARSAAEAEEGSAEEEVGQEAQARSGERDED